MIQNIEAFTKFYWNLCKKNYIKQKLQKSKGWSTFYIDLAYLTYMPKYHFCQSAACNLLHAARTNGPTESAVDKLKETGRKKSTSFHAFKY